MPQIGRADQRDAPLHLLSGPNIGTASLDIADLPEAHGFQAPRVIRRKTLLLASFSGFTSHSPYLSSIRSTATSASLARLCASARRPA